MEENNIISDHTMDLFNYRRNTVKVIGIGNTGCSIVDYMRLQPIKGVDFVVYDFNPQNIKNDGFPNKIRQEAIIAEDAVQATNLKFNPVKDAPLNGFTKVVLVIAEMGGTTERVIVTKIAKSAKEIGIITVGIVSIPFLSDGNLKYEKALQDIDLLRKHFDSLLVIDTNKLNPPNAVPYLESVFLPINTTFTTLVKGITTIVLHPNFDLNNIKTVLCNGGSILVGFSVVSGRNRAEKAIRSALFSPLVRDAAISNAKNILLLIISGTTEISIDEIAVINDYIQVKAGYKAHIIMSVGEDNNLGESLTIAIIASGFDNLA
jgi:cell division protein FtsZ